MSPRGTAAGEAVEPGVGSSTTGAGTVRGVARRWARPSVLAWLLALAAALPALIVAVGHLGDSWLPQDDFAPIELRVRDVGTADTPLVGPYSRYGWNHPGPALYEVLALPYAAGGAVGLLVGAALVNAVAVATSVRLAFRQGGLGLATVLAALVLAMTAAMGPERLADPWNPFLALLPFLLCAVATWATTCGDRVALPVAVAAGSFCVQSHVGYALLVGAAGALVAARLVVDRHHLGRWRTALVVGALVGVALWAPPAVEQVTASPGNVTEIVEQARAPGEPTQGVDGIRTMVLPHLGVTPAWFDQRWIDPFSSGGRAPGLPRVPLGLVAFLAAAALALARRDLPASRLAGVVAVLWVAGALSATRITGFPAGYLFRWSWVLALLLWASALWGLGRAAIGALRGGARAADLGRALRVLGVVAVAAALVAGAVVGADGWGAEPPSGDGRGMAELGDAAVAALAGEVGDGAVVGVEGVGEVVFQVPSMLVSLERAGYRVRVAEDLENVYGDHRARGGPTAATVIVADDPEAALAAHPDARLVATTDLLDPDERADWEAVDGLAPRCEEAMWAYLGGDEHLLGPEELAGCDRRAELAYRARVLSVLVAPGRPG